MAWLAGSVTLRCSASIRVTVAARPPTKTDVVGAKRSPVIVLTTTDDQREIQRCYDLGANVYIVKPVNYESFANAIRQLGLFLSVIQVP